MERKVKTEAPVSVGGITIVPVVELRLGCRRASRRLFFSAVKQPRAVLITTDGRWRAFAPDGRELPLDEVLAEVSSSGSGLFSDEDG